MGDDGEEGDVEELERTMVQGSRMFSRVTGLWAGAVILLTSVFVLVAGFAFMPDTLRWFIYSPLGLMMGVLDLFAVYWIVTGLNPSYTVSNLVSEKTSFTELQITSAFIFAAVLFFWGLLAVMDEPILERLFLFLLTLPGALIGLYGIRSGSDSPIERYMERLKEESS